MSGLLEESLAVELQDLDDVGIPVEMLSLNNGHGQLPSTGIVESTAASATPPIEERSEGTINDEDVCRDFIEKKLWLQESQWKTLQQSVFIGLLHRMASTGITAKSE